MSEKEMEKIEYSAGLKLIKQLALVFLSSMFILIWVLILYDYIPRSLIELGF
ncbi:hypothetical protein ES702_05543 [subsurface metagenome]